MPAPPPEAGAAAGAERLWLPPPPRGAVVLSRDPQVYYVDDFAAPLLCEHMIRLASAGLETSTVSTPLLPLNACSGPF